MRGQKQMPEQFVIRNEALIIVGIETGNLFL